MSCTTTLQTIIGLTDRDPSCFDSEPSGYDTSVSGFYLTDSEYGFPFLDSVWAGRAKDDSTIWDTLSRAREQGIREFEMELARQVQMRKKERLNSWYGRVGKNEVGMSLTPQGDFIGIEVCPKKYKGSYWTIEKIGLALDTTATDIPVKIVKVCDDYVSPDYIAEFTIDSSANTMLENTLGSAIELPLWDEDCDELEYRILLELPSGATPKKSRFKCCSKRETWMEFLTPSGISADSYTGNTLESKSDSFGISIIGRLECKGFEWLCNDLDELKGYNVLKVVARAIQCAASSKICSNILETSNVSEWTLLSREAIGAKKQFLHDSFMSLCEWLADNLPENATDCFVCKKSNFKKSSILI